MDVSVVIVTYNSAHCVERAIASVPPGCDIVVVDNASSDASAAVAEAAGARLVRNPTNLGFGTACNRGAQAARRSHLLFLNPDAALASDALTRLLQASAKHPEASAFGARLVDPGEVERAARCTVDEVRHVDMLSGAALFIARAHFDRVGGFDETLFLYFEDEDLSLRLQRAIGPTLEVADALVTHRPGTGARLSNRQRFEKYRNYGRSRRYFCMKHHRHFRWRREAAKQFGKGVVALIRVRTDHAAQHFGRCAGYMG